MLRAPKDQGYFVMFRPEGKCETHFIKGLLRFAVARSVRRKKQKGRETGKRA